MQLIKQNDTEECAKTAKMQRTATKRLLNKVKKVDITKAKKKAKVGIGDDADTTDIIREDVTEEELR